MKKIAVVITARPSYGRIKSFIRELEASSKYNLDLILASSAVLDKYGHTDKVIRSENFKINKLIYNQIVGDSGVTMCKTTANQISDLSSYLEESKPDAVVTIADRYETIATSIAASYMNIPLIHVQGGEVTGNIDEKTRHANTKLADLHLVCNKDAQKRVTKLGEDKNKVIMCGCPSIDIARKVSNLNFNIKDILNRYKGVGRIDKNIDKYYVILQHPTTDSHLESEKNMQISLEALKKIKSQVFVFWPNSDVGTDGTSRAIRKFREQNNDLPFFYFKNFSPEDFLKLLIKSVCIIGNSSVGIRETSFLGVPSVNIGSRQSGRLRGKNVIDVGHKENEILKAISFQTAHGHYKRENLYGDGNSGKKMVRALDDFDYSFTKKINY